MKLRDILLEFDSLRPDTADVDDYFDALEQRMANGELRKLNDEGNFSVVYDVPSKTNTVLKRTNRRVSPEQLAKDGYLLYLDAIAGAAENNIHLPQIASIRFVRDSSGGYFYEVELEKLYSYDQLASKSSSKAMLAMVKRYAPSMNFERYKKYFAKSYSSTKARNEDLFFELMTDFAEELETAMQGGDHKIEDPQMLKAIEVLQSAYKKRGNTGADLHDENIMFRLSPYGIVPVVIDPLN